MHVKNILNCSYCAGMIDLATVKRNSSALLILKYYALNVTDALGRQKITSLTENFQIKLEIGSTMQMYETKEKT